MAAIFWQAQPLQLYSGVARDLSARYGLSTAQNARLFGMLTLGVGGRRDRVLERQVPAPVLAPDRRRSASPTPTATRATEADPTWRPLFDPATPTTPALATPNFPDHPSGHSCVSSAVVNVLQDFFRSDRIAFDVTSPRFPGQPRHFERFSHLLDEIIEARVWGGIHFRTADVQGARLGEKVVRWQRWAAFQPVHGRY